ncbi:TPA: hypothetical protein JCW53_002068 [Salmonella enterica subsp. enterica serovar Typhimurium]|nr:hypothetical protein [Salmonella enterica subsp. enterica serovar Typhimurium]
MTPRQRRQHRNAIEKAAAAPRKSWLGKFRPLTSVQSAWVKSLLSVWGECYGGRTSEEAMLDCCGFWSCLQDEEWTDNEAKRITETIKGLRKIGYKGEALLSMARQILWPKQSIADLLNKEMRIEESDFVERCILSALSKDDPVFVVGIDFYACRKRVSDIGRYLQEIAPWLTRKQAEDRVRWCVNHFNCAVFLAFRDAMRKQNEKIS